MDKVVKREVVLEESEKSVGAETRMESSDNFEGSTRSDSRDSFWHSYPLERMSFIQREYFKAIMRKEVRSK